MASAAFGGKWTVPAGCPWKRFLLQSDLALAWNAPNAGSCSKCVCSIEQPPLSNFFFPRRFLQTVFSIPWTTQAAHAAWAHKVSSPLHPVWLLPGCLPLIPVWPGWEGWDGTCRGDTEPVQPLCFHGTAHCCVLPQQNTMCLRGLTPPPDSPLFPFLCTPCWEWVCAASPRVTLAVSQFCFSPSSDSPNSFTASLPGIHNCSHHSHFGKSISRVFTLFCHKSVTNIINPSAGTNLQRSHSW